MAELQDVVRSYYREKRIQRILLLLEPPVQEIDRKGRAPLISHDTKVRFVITMAAMVVLGIPMRILSGLHFPTFILLFYSLISAVAAVEISDYVCLKMMGLFDAVSRYLMPLMVLLSLFAFSFLSTVSNQVRSNFKSSRPKIEKPVAPVTKTVTGPLLSSGENWFLVVDQKGMLKKIPSGEAPKHCLERGPKYNLLTPESISRLFPTPKVAANTAIWIRGGSWAGLFTGEIIRPPQFSAPSSPTAAVLCVRDL